MATNQQDMAFLRIEDEAIMRAGGQEAVNLATRLMRERNGNAREMLEEQRKRVESETELNRVRTAYQQLEASARMPEEQTKRLTEAVTLLQAIIPEVPPNRQRVLAKFLAIDLRHTPAE